MPESNPARLNALNKRVTTYSFFLDPLKEKIQSVLNFSPAERRGMLALVVFIILITLLPHFYSKYFGNDYSIEIQTLKSALLAEKNEIYHLEKNSKSQFRLFPFDPNIIEEGDLLSLGFPKFLAKRMIKYRLAGGRFRQKSDLLSLYGMDSAFYNRLVPYISIKVERNVYEKPLIKKKASTIIDINKCDSMDLLSVNGIGPTFSSRIIRYREKIGGFYSLEQIKEVYGIKDSLYQTMLPSLEIKDSLSLKKIELNSVSLRDLRSHPYFRDYNLSKVIINYREQHDGFKSIEDIRSIHLVNDSLFEKVTPYLRVE